MTKQLTWNLQVEPGAVNRTFNSKMIFKAFARIERYWDVRFIQVTSRPSFAFRITHQHPNPTWAAWTTGRTVFIPSRFRYMSDDQVTFVLVHELGHIISPGNRHAKSAMNVMYPSITDVYKNFHLEDPQWYRLPTRSQPKFINEPNYWRPDPKVHMALPEPCEVGHGSWSDWFRTFKSQPIEKVEE